MKKWKERLVNNWGLKLISLSIAFALWFVVISINDPIDDKTFTNIRVNLTNTELLTGKDKVYEVLEGTNLLRTVSFEAPKSIREKIEASDIIAEADFNEMTSTDTVPIKFYCPKYGADVTNINGNISYVKLNVEEKVSKWIDINYKLIGTVEDGYVINSVNLDQNRLEVTGPASKIAEITKAVVDVNVTDISNDISARGDIQLINANGDSLRYDSVTKNTENIKVNVVVYAMKEVPIEFHIKGEPAEGYMHTGEVISSIDAVWIAGPAYLLNTITTISVPAEELDITNATESLIKNINLKRVLPSGIYFANKSFDGKIEAKVMIEKIAERELEISRLNLQIVNKPINKVIEYVDDVELPKLVIQGLEKNVNAVNPETIQGVVDVGAWMHENNLEELPSSTYQVPITFDFEEGIKQKEGIYAVLVVMTPEEYAIRVRLGEANN